MKWMAWVRVSPMSAGVDGRHLPESRWWVVCLICGMLVFLGGGRRRSEESWEEGRLRRLEAVRYEKGPGSEICGPSEVVRTGLPSARSKMRVSSVPALLPERPPAKRAEGGRRKHVESRFQFR